MIQCRERRALVSKTKPLRDQFLLRRIRGSVPAYFCSYQVGCFIITTLSHSSDIFRILQEATTNELSKIFRI